jgi:hypothetical protein
VGKLLLANLIKATVSLGFADLSESVLNLVDLQTTVRLLTLIMGESNDGVQAQES